MSEEMTGKASNQAAVDDLNGGQIASGLLVGLVAACLGGALFWLVHWSYYPYYELPPGMMTTNVFPQPEEIEALKEAQSSVDFKHAVLFMSVFGALVGVTLSMGEVICRRTFKRAVLCIAVGLIAGALFGCLGGIAGQAVYAHLKWNVESTKNVRTISTQVVMFAVMGGGIGLGFGALAGRMRTAVNCAVYGLLAGILAGILYPFLTASLLPPGDMDLIIPREADLALMWIGLPSALIGLFVTNAAHKSPPGISRPAVTGTAPAADQAIKASSDEEDS